MGIDMARLGKGAQQQIERKMGRQRPRESKYKAERTTITTSSGERVTFASQREARRYRELETLWRAGEITQLKCQVPFELVPAQTNGDGKRERPVKYIADFTYRDHEGRFVVEDTKGYRDTKSPVYQLFTVKRKLMLERYGITVREV